MTEIKLDRETVIAKLYELQSRSKTAAFFCVNKETMRRHLDSWGVEVIFSGNRHPAVTRHQRPALGEPKFKPGDIVIWKPRSARGGHFGLPIATAALKVRILKKRKDTGYYMIEVLDASARFQLKKASHNVLEHSLEAA